MDNENLIKQLKEQNKLLRRECQAAQEMDDAFQAMRGSRDARQLKRYERARENWLAAQAARIDTEPPF